MSVKLSEAEKFLIFHSNPLELGALHVSDLEQLIQKFPYCQTLKSLLAQASKETNQFEHYLGVAAAFAPSRESLHHFIQNPAAFVTTIHSAVEFIETEEIEEVQDFGQAFGIDLNETIVKQEQTEIIKPFAEIVNQQEELLAFADFVEFENVENDKVEAIVDIEIEEEESTRVEEERIEEVGTIEDNKVEAIADVEVEKKTSKEVEVEIVEEVENIVEEEVLAVADVEVEDETSTEVEIVEEVENIVDEGVFTVADAEVEEKTLTEVEEELVREAENIVVEEEVLAFADAEVEEKTLTEVEEEIVGEAENIVVEEEVLSVADVEVEDETSTEVEEEIVGEAENIVVEEEVLAVADVEVEDETSTEVEIVEEVENIVDEGVFTVADAEVEEKTSKEVEEEEKVKNIIDEKVEKFAEVAVEIEAVEKQIEKENPPSNITAPKEKLVFDSPVQSDFFAFNAKKESLNKISLAQKEQDVTQYHDETMPYTFLWWLNKTRKEYAANLRPFATNEPLNKGENKIIPVQDSLNNQIAENIFHLKGVEEIDVNFKRNVTVPFNFQNKEHSIIEKFIKEEPSIKPPAPNKVDTENKAKKSSEDTNDVVSETLAKIYVEQMLYHKALDVYKKLSLKFPEKSAYFASQIKYLELKVN